VAYGNVQCERGVPGDLAEWQRIGFDQRSYCKCRFCNKPLRPTQSVIPHWV